MDCDNLINSLKLLTNQQRDCDSPVESLVAGKVRRINFSGPKKWAHDAPSSTQPMWSGVRAVGTSASRRVADWHAFYQASYQGIEGQEWETMYYFKVCTRLGTRKPGENQKGKRSVRHESGKRQRRAIFMTPSKRPSTRLGLWEEHLKSPVAVAKALEC